jgi:hypothetical protein
LSEVEGGLGEVEGVGLSKVRALGLAGLLRWPSNQLPNTLDAIGSLVTLVRIEVSGIERRLEQIPSARVVGQTTGPSGPGRLLQQRDPGGVSDRGTHRGVANERRPFEDAFDDLARLDARLVEQKARSSWTRQRVVSAVVFGGAPDFLDQHFEHVRPH